MTSRPRRAGPYLLLAIAVGCGGGSSGGAASIAPGTSVAVPSSAAPRAVVAPTASAATPAKPPSGTWLKGDFHVHSAHSGDAVKFGDDVATVIKCAERAGLDFTTISDHRTTDCLRDPQFLGARTSLVLIPGEEWGGPGHAGAHGLTRDPVYHSQEEGQGPAVAVQKIQQAIDDVHSMGGIFVLNHTIDDKSMWLWPADRFDAIEVWNQSWAFRSTAAVTSAQVSHWIADHKLDQPGGPRPMPEALRASAIPGGGQNWQRLKHFEEHLESGRHVAAVGGGDSHYFVLPGQPTTVVFAEQRTMAGVLDGVRKGRTMVQRAPDAPTLEFTADRDGDGVYESIIGDRIPLGRPVKFRIFVKDAPNGRVDLVKNGRKLQSWPIGASKLEVTLTDTPASRSWYRVDCYERLDMSMPHASTLKAAVLGTSSMPWLSALTSGSLAKLLGGNVGKWAGNLQKVLDEGGPAALWLIVYGQQVGVRTSPVATRFPRLEFPKPVSQILNVAPNDDDFCMGVVTSPIWVE